MESRVETAREGGACSVADVAENADLAGPRHDSGHVPPCGYRAGTHSRSGVSTCAGRAAYNNCSTVIGNDLMRRPVAW
jgi:hypothetical protein